MLQGEFYQAWDLELSTKRQKTKKRIFQYNQTDPEKIEERNKILQELLGKIGEGFEIEQPFYCDYGENIEIGKNFYANHNCVILDVAKIKIGDDVLIGPPVGILAAGHPVDPEVRKQKLEYGKPITIRR